MMHDPFAQLADTTVPPLPGDFDRAVHQRLNRTLVVGQLTEFACIALPCALAEFARALAAAVAYSSSGRYPAASEKNQEQNNQA